MNDRRDALRRLIAHAIWANHRIAAALDRFDPLDRRLLDWFAHVVTTERIYFERLTGRDPWPQDFWPNLGLDECRGVAAANADRYGTFLDEIGSAALGLSASYRDSSGRRHETPVAQLIEHVALHGSYHRGQIAARLRRRGAQPPATDYITFLREE